MRDDLKVLVVDDDIINRKLLAAILKKCSKVKEVVEASNGLDALKIIKDKQNEIDLVLLDMKMPIMNGLQFLSIYNADEEINSIPVMVLTTDDTIKGDAIENGAVDFMVKPIKESLLIQKIKDLAVVL